jgi:cytoplasmic iron level regulating protein YaaA (DUF328/UPF0246 family)
VRAPAILLPPSEGKSPGGRGRAWAPGTLALPDLDADRAAVLAALGGEVAAAPTTPVIARYTGVLYQELAYATLPVALRRRVDRSVLVFSGLWGVVRPRDPVPAYRLKMGASLPGLGKLSTWWRPRLTAALAPALRGRVVWDLLPAEHAAAWSPAEVPVARRITVRFVDAGGRTVSHWNKLLKGALVRHVLAEGITDPGALADFEHPSGYRLDPAASDLDGPVAAVVLRAG